MKIFTNGKHLWVLAANVSAVDMCAFNKRANHPAPIDNFFLRWALTVNDRDSEVWNTTCRATAVPGAYRRSPAKGRLRHVVLRVGRQVGVHPLPNSLLVDWDLVL